MATLNKVFLICRLGHDPKLRKASGGMSICNVNAATNEYKGKGKDRQEFAEWHRLTFFAKQADVLCDYGQKGSLIYAEGRLQTSKYTDKEGVEKYSTSILVNNFQFLMANTMNPFDGNSYQQPQNSGQKNQDVVDDDVPF